MSSTILHLTGKTLSSPVLERPDEAMVPAGDDRGTAAQEREGEKNPFLVALGERVRSLRARRGMTRKALAVAAEISERHLANLEYGVGNASILILQNLAQALHCTLAEMIGDPTTATPEWLMLREVLVGQDEAALRRVRLAVSEMLHGSAGGPAQRSRRIALIGLRGAGKSTLGRMLAEALGCPFIELSGEIEKVAGCSVAEIQALYGQSAYRRYERRALEEAIQAYSEVVIATPGGLVSDPATFTEVLNRCTTVWLQAKPEDHMGRVMAQGDMRPMAASREAMEDLRGILAGRTAFYSKAEIHIDTSAQPLAETFDLLRRQVAAHIEKPVSPTAGM